MASSSTKIPRTLSSHMVDFGRFLRNHGFMIGPKEETEALLVMSKTPFSSFDNFRLLLKVVFSKTFEQQRRFDDLFHQFWQELFKSFDAKLKTGRLKPRDNAQEQKNPLHLAELKSWLFQHDHQKQEEAAFYSQGKAQNGDLKDYEASQLNDLGKFLQQFTRDWANSQSRRFVSGRRPLTSIDLRKTIRNNIHRGEFLDLAYRRKKIQKLDLVVLCDVSRSMELFSKFTVQLLYAFQNSYRSIDTFVFGTQLFRISPWLKQYGFEEALKKIKQEVPDWSGGTRIGYSLQQFILGYGQHLLHKKSLVLIISDGWDTGEAELLDWSMAYIQRRVKKLIWLNPQAGKPEFEPKVTGMKTALPHIDVFQGVHNLESLKRWQKGGYRSL